MIKYLFFSEDRLTIKEFCEFNTFFKKSILDPSNIIKYREYKIFENILVKCLLILNYNEKNFIYQPIFDDGIQSLNENLEESVFFCINFRQIDYLNIINDIHIKLFFYLKKKKNIDFDFFDIFINKKTELIVLKWNASVILNILIFDKNVLKLFLSKNYKCEIFNVLDNKYSCSLTNNNILIKQINYSWNFIFCIENLKFDSHNKKCLLKPVYNYFYGKDNRLHQLNNTYYKRDIFLRKDEYSEIWKYKQNENFYLEKNTSYKKLLDLTNHLNKMEFYINEDVLRIILDKKLKLLNEDLFKDKLIDSIKHEKTNKMKLEILNQVRLNNEILKTADYICLINKGKFFLEIRYDIRLRYYYFPQPFNPTNSKLVRHLITAKKLSITECINHLKNTYSNPIFLEYKEDIIKFSSSYRNLTKHNLSKFKKFLTDWLNITLEINLEYDIFSMDIINKENLEICIHAENWIELIKTFSSFFIKRNNIDYNKCFEVGFDKLTDILKKKILLDNDSIYKFINISFESGIIILENNQQALVYHVFKNIREYYYNYTIPTVFLSVDAVASVFQWINIITYNNNIEALKISGLIGNGNTDIYSILLKEITREVKLKDFLFKKIFNRKSIKSCVMPAFYGQSERGYINKTIEEFKSICNKEELVIIRNVLKENRKKIFEKLNLLYDCDIEMLIKAVKLKFSHTADSKILNYYNDEYIEMELSYLKKKIKNTINSIKKYKNNLNYEKKKLKCLENQSCLEKQKLEIINNLEKYNEEDIIWFYVKKHKHLKSNEVIQRLLINKKIYKLLLKKKYIKIHINKKKKHRKVLLKDWDILMNRLINRKKHFLNNKKIIRYLNKKIIQRNKNKINESYDRNKKIKKNLIYKNSIKRYSIPIFKYECGSILKFSDIKINLDTKTDFVLDINQMRLSLLVNGVHGSDAYLAKKVAEALKYPSIIIHDSYNSAPFYLKPIILLIKIYMCKFIEKSFDKNWLIDFLDRPISDELKNKFIKNYSEDMFNKNKEKFESEDIKKFILDLKKRQQDWKNNKIYLKIFESDNLVY